MATDTTPSFHRNSPEPPHQPQWLTPTEREVWLGMARLLATLPAALDAQLTRDAGLTFYEYTVLAMLSEQPDRTLRMSTLAEVTNASQSRLSNVVKRLEVRGLVQRRADPADGRCTQAVLCEAGWNTVVSAAPQHVAAVRELVIDAMDLEQLRQISAIHQRILARLDPRATTYPVYPGN
jgi:DNA-binding MarR family transcriptional regulator